MLASRIFIFLRGYDQNFCGSGARVSASKRILLTPETTNFYDRNAIVATDQLGRRVGRVARELAVGCGSMLRGARRVGITYLVNFLRLSQEELPSRFGEGDYTSTVVELEVLFYSKSRHKAIVCLTGLSDHHNMGFEPSSEE